MGKFLWGASTSSFQIEGAAKEDGRGPSIWDTLCARKDGIANGDTGDVACDHYHRYREDVALMKEMGLNAYRFSIAWPRLLPKGKGALNEKGLDFYDRLIDALLDAGIEPWACLYHWDLPQALQDLGGWQNRDAAGWFADYAALCAKRYGDRVKHWATFNEFSVFTLFAYALGWGAPNISNRQAHLQAMHVVNLAHGKGVDALRATIKDGRIGAVHSFQPCKPQDDAPENVEAAALFTEIWNTGFPDAQLLGAYPERIARQIEPYVRAGDMAAINRPVDWFGLNYYSPIFARHDPGGMQWDIGWGAAPEGMPMTDIGWPMSPETFTDALHTITKRYRLPVYVTENGYGVGSGEAPDESGNVNDESRRTFLESHIQAMLKAKEEGADVRGYFLWSLLDNFEWGAGYNTRFGIVHVDFKTLKRTPKASAKWYTGFIRQRRS